MTRWCLVLRRLAVGVVLASQCGCACMLIRYPIDHRAPAQEPRCTRESPTPWVDFGLAAAWVGSMTAVVLAPTQNQHLRDQEPVAEVGVVLLSLPWIVSGIKGLVGLHRCRTQWREFDQYQAAARAAENRLLPTPPVKVSH